MLTTNNRYMAFLVVAATAGVVVIASSYIETANAQNMTSILLKNAREDFSQAVEALDSNNVTGAVSEARRGMFYLEMLGAPVHCMPNNIGILECGFVSTDDGMSQYEFP